LRLFVFQLQLALILLLKTLIFNFRKKDMIIHQYHFANEKFLFCNPINYLLR